MSAYFLLLFGITSFNFNTQNPYTVLEIDNTSRGEQYYKLRWWLIFLTDNDYFVKCSAGRRHVPMNRNLFLTNLRPVNVWFINKASRFIEPFQNSEVNSVRNDGHFDTKWKRSEVHVHDLYNNLFRLSPHSHFGIFI